jgi:hypothetical protein
MPYPARYFLNDDAFNKLYPPYIRQLARKHWTPLDVAKQAAEFLVMEDKVKVLDIGSGVGKFCIAAAYYKPNAFYVGVEQRENLAIHAEITKNALGFTNITFINSNFTGLDFKQYNHFYFYNSFYEHIVDVGRIDESIIFSRELFVNYSTHLLNQLDEMPKGTRLVTYHTTRTEIPQSFNVVREGADGFLKFCIKV